MDCLHWCLWWFCFPHQTGLSSSVLQVLNQSQSGQKGWYLQRSGTVADQSPQSLQAWTEESLVEGPSLIILFWNLNLRENLWQSAVYGICFIITPVSMSIYVYWKFTLSKKSEMVMSQIILCSICEPCFVWPVYPPVLPEKLSVLKADCPGMSWNLPDDITDDIIPGTVENTQHHPVY